MNIKKTILDRAIEALEDYLNAGHKELRRQAAEKAKKVYEDYYGKPYENRVKAPLKKEERIYVPDSIKVGFGAIANGGKRLYYSRIFKDWFVCLEPSEDASMQRPYLEMVDELEVGKVYLPKWKPIPIKDLETSYLPMYTIYLGGDKYVTWSEDGVRELSLAHEDYDFYEVKGEV